jgi:1-acyl-sn-glycerol-3-phosphate acyltransferase
MIFWRMVTQIFFREIRPRGAFNIPRSGPVIFVGAPHNNQVCQLALAGAKCLTRLVSGPAPP